MPNFPPVGIVVTTYVPEGEIGESRIKAYEESLLTWKLNLKYDGDAYVIIADDGSSKQNFKRMVDFANDHFGAIGMQKMRHGVGSSLNMGMYQVFVDSPIALYMVDDWALDVEFDLTPWVDLFNQGDIGMIRLGPPHPWLQGTVEHYDGRWILRCDRHHYVYGMRPALYHKRFFEQYGWFDEDCSSMECERLYNERFCKAEGPDIVLALPHAWRIVENVELGYLNPVTESNE